MVLYSCPRLTCPALKSMYDSKNSADVQLSAGENGRRIFAHKDVLSAATEYFKRMFQNSFRESIESIVVIQNMDSDTLDAVIQFIYCGTVEISRLENAIELMNASHLMELPELIKCSEDYLVKTISESVCLELFFQSKLLKTERLTYKAKIMIANNFKTISQITYFKQLEKDLLVELVTEIQDSACEDDLAEGILAWVAVDQQRLNHFKELLQLMKIESIKQDSVIDKLCDCCSGKEECEIIIKALKKRRYSAKPVQTINRKSQTLVAFDDADESKYSIVEYDFTNKIVSKGTEVENHGQVLGVWDENILFLTKKEFIIYDAMEKHVSFSISVDSYDSDKITKKNNDIIYIRNNIYILSDKIIYKLNLIDKSLEEIVPPQELKKHRFDAMCKFKDELKIIAFDTVDDKIVVVTYDPFNSLWSRGATVTDRSFELNDSPGIVVADKKCIFFFKKDQLNIYDLENHKWNIIKTKPDIYSTSIQNAVSIDDKLIICTWNGAYECIVDEKKLKRLDIFGVDCAFNYDKLLNKN